MNSRRRTQAGSELSCRPARNDRVWGRSSRHWRARLRVQDTGTFQEAGAEEQVLVAHTPDSTRARSPSPLRTHLIVVPEMCAAEDSECHDCKSKPEFHALPAERVVQQPAEVQRRPQNSTIREVWETLAGAASPPAPHCVNSRICSRGTHPCRRRIR